jgi:hypothetical protein
MPFYLRKDVSDWFKHLQSTFDTGAPKFDMYYLCLMAGMATKNLIRTEASDLTELTDRFPGPYKKRAHLIVGTFLAREAARLGITLSDKEAVREHVARLVNPADPYLSPDGLGLLNRYCHGGADVLMEWFDPAPRYAETFLPRFRDKINEVCSSR